MPILNAPLPDIEIARAVRDGGIDAVAALDNALGAVIAKLTAEQAEPLKRAFGHAMAEVIEQIINPAVRSFPELDPVADWSAIVGERLGARLVQWQARQHSTDAEDISPD